MAGACAQTESACQFDRAKILAELDDKGYCVIPCLLAPEECDRHIAFYQDWLSQCGEGNFPFHLHSIIQSYRIGHFKSTWEVRLSAKKVFEMVWQTKKLLTSFDGVAIGPPPEVNGKGYTTPEASWLHLDQSPSRRGLHCYQGAVYLEETTDTDYCFRVLEGSHKYTDDFYNEQNRGRRPTDFFKLNNAAHKWYTDHGCQLTNVPVPKGGIVLWDSRLVHDNRKPEFRRPNRDRWRWVVFVCMQPAQWATHADLEKKREAYKKMLMTAHWPAQGVRFFKNWDEQDKLSGILLLSKLPDVARSEEARRLAGVLEYDFEDGEPNGPGWRPEWVE